ncbi:MAG: hypothetical protein R2824_30940 [Saprospiraceae bacterium]
MLRKILFPAGIMATLLIFLTACGGNVSSETDTTTAAVQDTFPSTPEGVVRLYQSYIDSNLFAQAQRLSTPRSAALHEMMAAIVADTPSDSSLIHTQFLTLNCVLQQDTAVCNCLLKDEYEEYASEYILIKSNGQWLVDLPDEEGDFELFEQETEEEWPEKE